MFTFAYTADTVFTICGKSCDNVTMWALVPDGSQNTPKTEGRHIVQINGKPEKTYWGRVDDETMAFTLLGQKGSE